jgi:hypothetical protein
MFSWNGSPKQAFFLKNIYSKPTTSPKLFDPLSIPFLTERDVRKANSYVSIWNYHVLSHIRTTSPSTILICSDKWKGFSGFGKRVKGPCHFIYSRKCDSPLSFCWIVPALYFLCPFWQVPNQGPEAKGRLVSLPFGLCAVITIYMNNPS